MVEFLLRRARSEAELYWTSPESYAFPEGGFGYVLTRMLSPESSTR